MSLASPELGIYSTSCFAEFQSVDISAETQTRILAGNSNMHGFAALGELDLGPALVAYAGLKRLVDDPVERVAAELHFGDKLLGYKPELAHNLPKFTFPVLSAYGEPIGVLTEDFTQNGAHHLHEFRQYFDHRNMVGDLEHTKAMCEEEDELRMASLYADVYEALTPGLDIDPEAFGRMMGELDGRVVLFDFDSVIRGIPDDVKGAYHSLAEATTVFLET